MRELALTIAVCTAVVGCVGGGGRRSERASDTGDGIYFADGGVPPEADGDANCIDGELVCSGGDVLVCGVWDDSIPDVLCKVREVDGERVPGCHDYEGYCGWQLEDGRWHITGGYFCMPATCDY